MGKIVFSVIAFFILLYPFKSLADVGCALNYGNSSSEVIYFTVIGTAGSGSWVDYGGSPTYNNVGFPNQCPRYVYSTALDDGGRCCVNGNCNNTTRTRVNFTPIPCPLDDYIPLLNLVVAVLALKFIRNDKHFSFAPLS
ncbi:hypothetical protein [Pedobacter aquatilis]|uniref:hypothetical protein n=1 Tax=Pedobacter aquatilis TaxID=351343 RepID=UPI00293000F9|nr:hypothetical protein [Pedobacter aquatilis]